MATAEDNNDEPVGRVLGLSLIELREPIVDTSRVSPSVHPWRPALDKRCGWRMRWISGLARGLMFVGNPTRRPLGRVWPSWSPETTSNCRPAPPPRVGVSVID